MNSNNKKIIFIVISLVLLGLIAYFSIIRVDQNVVDKELSDTTNVNQVDDGTSIFKGSLLDLAKAGGNMTCSYSINNVTPNVNGNSYIAGKNMRVDFDIKVEGQAPVTSHMVSDGEWIYTWVENSPNGMKMNIEDAKLAQESMPKSDGISPTQQDLSDLQNKIDFKCSKWTPDNSIFALPQGVEFMELSVNTPSETQPGQNNMCAACNYMQDAEQKAECMTKLNCN